MTFSEHVVVQRAKIKRLEDGLAGCGTDIEADAVQANLTIARSNLLIAEALDRIAFKMTGVSDE